MGINGPLVGTSNNTMTSSPSVKSTCLLVLSLYCVYRSCSRALLSIYLAYSFFNFWTIWYWWFFSPSCIDRLFVLIPNARSCGRVASLAYKKKNGESVNAYSVNEKAMIDHFIPCARCSLRCYQCERFFQKSYEFFYFSIGLHVILTALPLGEVEAAAEGLQRRGYHLHPRVAHELFRTSVS